MGLLPAPGGGGGEEGRKGVYLRRSAAHKVENIRHRQVDCQMLRCGRAGSCFRPRNDVVVFVLLNVGALVANALLLLKLLTTRLPRRGDASREGASEISTCDAFAATARPRRQERLK